MSHPLLGHDYSERHKEESSKEYSLRKAKGMKRDSPKSKALEKSKYTDKGVRILSKSEQAEKTKNWPKSSGSSTAWPNTDKEKSNYQRRFGRASNE